MGPHQAQDHLSRGIRQRESCLMNAPQHCGRGPAIPKTRLQWRKADIAIGQAGVEATETAGSATVVLDEADIQSARSSHRASGPDAAHDDGASTVSSPEAAVSMTSRRNPQQFIELAAQAVNRCKRQALVGRHQVPAYRRRGLLRAGAFPAGRTHRLSEEHAAFREISLREGDIRIRDRGSFRRPA